MRSIRIGCSQLFVSISMMAASLQVLALAEATVDFMAIRDDTGVVFDISEPAGRIAAAFVLSAQFCLGFTVARRIIDAIHFYVSSVLV